MQQSLKITATLSILPTRLKILLTRRRLFNLDLVISADTSVAHLAGALGKPVWILLSYVPDWRWLLDRDDSPWYPTARRFRQNDTREWDSVIARVRESLLTLIGNGGESAASIVQIMLSLLICTCPLWVKSRHSAINPCPLYPRKRTLQSGLTIRRNKFGRSK